MLRTGVWAVMVGFLGAGSVAVQGSDARVTPWTFQPLRRPMVPKVHNAGAVRTPIA